jgi:hypothetical protein
VVAAAVLWHDAHMRARTVLLLSLPLLLLSETFGHALVARMLDPGTARHRMLLSATVDYHGYAEAALAVVLVLVGWILVVRALASSHATGPRPLPSWRLAVIPPLVFLVQEHVEHLVRDGSSGWFTAVEPTVLAGIALQIPCGLLALWLVRVLLKAADQIGCALASRSSRATRRPTAGLTLFVYASPLRLRVLASQHAGRAPPAFA